jgi:ABC-type uncharacterized transport system substrate-binding protein
MLPIKKTLVVNEELLKEADAAWKIRDTLDFSQANAIFLKLEKDREKELDRLQNEAMNEIFQFYHVDNFQELGNRIPIGTTIFSIVLNQHEEDLIRNFIMLSNQLIQGREVIFTRK